MSPDPKAAFASSDPRFNASSISDSFLMTRMPRPPPPATALRIMFWSGWIEAKNSVAVVSSSIMAEAGNTGTSFVSAKFLDRNLSPKSSSALGLGPTKTMFASRQARAN